jgi:hypothetical protein
MNISSIVQDIQALHHDTIISWKEHGIKLIYTDFLHLVEENHSFNYQLWHAEDRARRDDRGADFVYTAKREIDSFNQQRNDRMEMMDEWLWHHLQPADHNYCTLHTETPGMIIDRMSILSLKQYHMQLQTIRTDVDPEHLNTCAKKLSIISEQLTRLSHSLQQLLLEIQNQTRTFKIYHQMKMYNNPKLNPELYNSSSNS